jgi:hypothetical protein
MGCNGRQIAANQADFALFVLDFELDEPVFLHQFKQSFNFARFHLDFQNSHARQQGWG